MTPFDLLWFDASAITHTRSRIDKGDPALEPPLRQLRADAEQALTQPPLTVTDKTTYASSDVPNDYVSLAPYWWPDPGKDDGLPYIRRDGESNPEKDDPQFTDRMRVTTIVKTVETLGWAYCFLHEERYAAHAAAMIRVFFLDEATRMNPHLLYSQGIRGQCDGRWIGIIDTRNFVRILDAESILRHSAAWTQADHAALVSWFADFAEWLTTHEFGHKEAAMHNNHGTWYDVQVGSFAAYLGYDELLRQTLKRARSRIDLHFDGEGKQPHELARTRSLSYSMMNLEGFMLLAFLGETAGIDLWGHRGPSGQSIQAGLDFLLPYVDPSRQWPYEQITPVNRAGLAPLLRMAEKAWGDPRYAEALDLLAEELAGHRIHLIRPSVKRAGSC